MKEAANESRHCLRKEESHGTMYTLFRRIISGLKLFRKVVDIDYDYATLEGVVFSEGKTMPFIMSKRKDFIMKKQSTIKIMIYAAMFLALAYVIPFLTGQIPQIGSMLCPMHIPVLLCGLYSGYYR